MQEIYLDPCSALCAHTDDQQTVRAKMECRTERIVLAHGAIAKIRPAELHRREEQRNGRARHQMLRCELGAPAQTLRTIPVCDPLDRVVKDHGMPTRIAGRAQGERAQMTARDVPANATAINMHVEQLTQRCIVEE